MAGKARSSEEDACRARSGKLTEWDHAVMLGMLGRGDRMVDVAYWYGVSPSTVHRVKFMVDRSKLRSFTEAELPPPGPYALVQRTELAALTTAKLMVGELKTLLEKYEAECTVSHVQQIPAKLQS